MSSNVREEVVRLIVDGRQVTGTYNELKKSQREITRNLRGMEEGSKDYNKESMKLQRVNQQLDRSSKKIKDVGNAWKNQAKEFKAGIGNQLSQFRVMGVSVGDVTSNISLMTKGISGSSNALKLFKVALVSTGLGALVVLLGSIISAIMNVQSQTDKWTKLTSQFGAVVNVLKDRLSLLGSAIINLLDGDFEQAQKDWAAATSDVADEIQREVELTGKLADMLVQLTRDENDQLLVQAQRKRQIQELIFLTRDETVSFEKRMQALLRANALEKENLRDNEDLQKRRVQQILQIESMSELEAKLADIRKNGLNLEDVGLALSSEEDRKEAIQAIVALEEMETQSLTRQRELRNRINELTNKQLATEKRLQQEFDKANDTATIDIQTTGIDFADEIDQQISEGQRLADAKIRQEGEVLAAKTNASQRAQDLKRMELELERNIANTMGHTIGMAIESSESIAEFGANFANGMREAVSAGVAAIVTNMILGQTVPPSPLSLFMAPIAASAAKTLINAAIPSFYFGGDTGDRSLGVGDQYGPFTGFVHSDEFVIPKAQRRDPFVAGTENYIENRKRLGAGGALQDRQPVSVNSSVQLQGGESVEKAAMMIQDAAVLLSTGVPAYFSRKSYRDATEDFQEKEQNRAKGSLRG